jgi:hypothetical protein
LTGALEEFLMHDGESEIACRASRELLRHRFGSSDPDGDGETFKLHREAIEKAASDKYDAGILEPHTDATVIVGEVDMASSLSRKI